MRRKFSWKPDVPDQRDYTFGRMTMDQGVKMSVLPTAVSMRRWCTEVEDQGSLGSCGANAVVGMMEFNQCKSGNGGSKLVQLSRLFNYYNSRVLGDNVNEDSGVYLRDAIKTLKLNGVAPANDWPHRERYWATQPPLNAYVNALQFRITRYYRLNTIDEMKSTLASGKVFIFGMAVYDSFLSWKVASDGIVPMPTSKERLWGGHAMVGIGYDDSTQRFLIRNSWGKEWGIKDGNLQGYCTMPYAYLESRNLSDDFWTGV
jgi:C1A family cysteine protease